MEENAKFCVVHITVRFTFLWNGWHVINIYMLNKRGPRMLPWGTPLTTVAVSFFLSMALRMASVV
jgi:hypothetical protein